MERHGPPLLTAGSSLGGHSLLDEAGQLGHDLRVGDVEREGIGGSQGVLSELQRQGREFGGVLPVKLLVGISETDYTKVHRGDKVEVTADAFPGRTFDGEINRIYPTIDPATHTFTVEIIVPNRDRVLRPGMFARVKVLFAVNRSVVVPDAAIVKQTGSGERFIYVLNPADSTVTYQNVDLGVRMDTEYEVLSGLKDGDMIVTEGQIRLKSGIKVSVKE